MTVRPGAAAPTIAPTVESGHAPEAATDIEYRYWNGQTFEAGTRSVPTETPVALRIGCDDYAVMLATPRDLVDFGHGWLLAEGLIAGAGDVHALEVVHGEAGAVIHAEIAHAGGGRARRMTGVTGCGLCGIERLDDVLQPAPTVGPGPSIPPQAITAAMTTLQDWQPLNAHAGALHAAAFADGEGRIIASREDVGRHNALDKLIGTLLCSGTEPRSGFVVMTSRCSYELVDKAARFGLGVLVTAAAPTGLAVQRARDAGLTLVNRARDGTFMIAAGAERIESRERA